MTTSHAGGIGAARRCGCWAIVIALAVCGILRTPGEGPRRGRPADPESLAAVRRSRGPAGESPGPHGAWGPSCIPAARWTAMSRSSRSVRCSSGAGRRRRSTSEWELLYPLVTYRRKEADWDFQFLRLLNARGEGSPQAGREEHADFFPFYFSGVRENGETYLGIMPFWGKVYDRLFWEEFEWVMFPLYARIVRSGAETHYFPWPLISTTRGVNPEENHRGFRFIPLYGQEVKDGVFEKYFALWPLFLYQRTGLDGDDPETVVTVLPFYVGATVCDAGPDDGALAALHLHRRSRAGFRAVGRGVALHQDRPRGESTGTAPLPAVHARPQGPARPVPVPGDPVRGLRRPVPAVHPADGRGHREPQGARPDPLVSLLGCARGRAGRLDPPDRRLAVRPLRAGPGGGGALPEPGAAGGSSCRGTNGSSAITPHSGRCTPTGANPAGESVHSFLWNFLRHEETQTGRSIEVLGPLFAYRETGEGARTSFLGGLVQYEVRPGARSVRLGTGFEMTWADPPQPVAALDRQEGTGEQPARTHPAHAAGPRRRSGSSWSRPSTGPRRPPGMPTRS